MVRNLNWSEIINRPSEKELYEANTNKIQLMRLRGILLGVVTGTVLQFSLHGNCFRDRFPKLSYYLFGN